MSSGSRNLIWLLLVLALASVTVTVCCSDTIKKKCVFPLITIHCEDQDLGIALKDIAKQMRINVCLGPDVAGEATLQAQDEKWDAVLSQILRGSGFQYKIVETGQNSPVLIVAASSTRLDQIGEMLRTTRGCSFPTRPDGKVRAEFLFQYASADSCLDFLRNKYDGVTFERHPVLNGFFATGSREDLDLIRKNVGNIDRPSQVTPAR